jgi:hypothetical protein
MLGGGTGKYSSSDLLFLKGKNFYLLILSGIIEPILTQLPY